MLSIGKLIATQAAYYTDQLNHSLGEDTPALKLDGHDQADYYSAHQAPARWLGSGLDRLELKPGSPVDPSAFARLMNHQTPGGVEMILPKAHRLKVAALDMTLSAPKSVSLMYAFGSEEVRQQVVEAHREAVDEALSYMEQHASKTRLVERSQGTDGFKVINTRNADSEGFVAAGFDHYTSRAQDPQLHTHVVAINRVYAEDGWRAIDGQRVYAHAKAGGTIYEAKLRQELTRRLGLSWGPVTNGIADVEGFSPELIRHFSTRRTEILEAVERHLAKHGGEAHRRLTQAFTLETRQPKVYEKDRPPPTRMMKDYGVSSTVESHWYQKAIDAPGDVIKIVEQSLGRRTEVYGLSDTDLASAAPDIIESLVQKQAVFTERDLIAQVATFYPLGASAEELTAAAKLVLTAGLQSGEVLSVLPADRSHRHLPERVQLTPSELELVIAASQNEVHQPRSARIRALPDETRFTTHTQLEREALVLSAVTTPSPIKVERSKLEAAIITHRLGLEQAAALRHLGRLDGQLVALVGPGGSGKTRTIGAYAEAVSSSGSLVIGVATSASAAARLGQELSDSWSGTIALLRHQLEASRQSLPERTVLIVDEASMVSTTDLAQLVKLTQACDGKLVLIGDPKQLPSIDAGGLFHRIVAQREQVADELASVNQRQRLDLDRHNLNRLRTGEIERAVRHYQEAGRLHLGKGEFATKSGMVEAWWRDVEVHGLEGVRMLSSRHHEVEMLNQLARVDMTEAHLLSGPVLRNRWGMEFQAGDRVVVRDNWYSHSDLRNGQTGTIASVEAEKGTVQFRRDFDGLVIDLPKPYVDRDLDYAYAQTIHTAQGQTFEVTHLYADLGVKAEHGYTALSRARGETHLWLNEAPGPLGECTYIQGDPLIPDRIEELVRQLTRSVIEPPAQDQGIALQSATDRELVEWRNDLDRTISQSPLAQNLEEKLVALDDAVDNWRKATERFDTSGTRQQLRELEAERARVVERQVLRQEWLEENVDLLHRYSALTEEFRVRLQARVASYALNPPEDLLQAIGPRPEEGMRMRQWDAIAELHAHKRLELGPGADLFDYGLPGTALYQSAVSDFRAPELVLKGPVLALRPPY